VLLRDRLYARLNEMGASPDYVRLAEEVLAIRNATPAMARRLVHQALVVEDRREAWAQVGQRFVAAAPETAGVYIFRDAAGRPLYVGKAINIRRRLRTHFASRRWKAIKSELSRVDDVAWREVGSELEALLLEAQWIRDLAPTVNVQRGGPSADRRIASRHARDVLVLQPSVVADSVEVIAARTAGPTLIHRIVRDGRHLTVDAECLWTFFGGSETVDEIVEPHRALAPIVFSWLAGRGANATRIEADDLLSADDLRVRLSIALTSSQLFIERLVVRNSVPRDST
jgi:predicted GIY-YIG superfamily endonuclease